MTREQFSHLFSNFLSEIRAAGVFERFVLSADQIPVNSSLPEDYIWFLRTFGAVHLFVRSYSSELVIRSCPRRGSLSQCGPILCILDGQGGTLAALEDGSGHLVVIGSRSVSKMESGFLAYLWSRVERSKKMLSNAKWAKISNDTYRFSIVDARIAQARKEVHVTLLKIVRPFTLVFAIANKSPVVLPYITLRVCNMMVPDQYRGIWLEIGHVIPGATADCEYDLSYDKELTSVPHEQIAVTTEPAPTPYLVSTGAFREFEREVAGTKPRCMPPWLS